MTPMFRLEEVAKVYSRRATQVVAFQTPSLEIATGDYVAIVGPSGSGKTTLLSLLGGLLSPTRGRVFLAGQSLFDLSVTARTRLRREKIGFVFQSFNLVPYLTAIENVQVPLYLAGVQKSDQQQRAAALLQRVGIGDRLHHKPSELSVGQQQRVALARTLANNPPVILADEPTGNLDPDSRQRVLDAFAELHRAGHTIVMVTHDLSAADHALRRLNLNGGAICNMSAPASTRAA
jgi:putative ABC transport system ATP-binding protein